MHKRMPVHYIWCVAIGAYCGYKLFRLTNSILTAVLMTFCWILCFLLADCIFYYSLCTRNHFPLQEVLKQNEAIILPDIPTIRIVPLRDIDILLQRIVVCTAITMLSFTPIGKTMIFLDRRRFLDVINQRMLTIPGVLYLTDNRIGFFPDLKRHFNRKITVILSDVINCEIVNNMVNSNPCLRIETVARKYDFLVTDNNLSSMKVILEKIKGVEMGGK